MDRCDPIDFCAAAAVAAEVARLERLTDIAARLIAHAAPSDDCAPLMRGLEAIAEDLVLAADEARDRLARAEAKSAAGAIAQLLGAIRDIRVGDDAERMRARMLETAATRFAGATGMLGADACALISQTRPAETQQPALAVQRG